MRVNILFIPLMDTAQDSKSVWRSNFDLPGQTFLRPATGIPVLL
jgi:hypothetical protein